MWGFCHFTPYLCPTTPNNCVTTSVSHWGFIDWYKYLLKRKECLVFFFHRGLIYMADHDTNTRPLQVLMTFKKKKIVGHLGLTLETHWSFC